MDRLRAGLQCCLHDQITTQIAVRNRCRTKANRLIRHRHMKRLCIGIGINRDRADPHGTGGADHAAGNLAAVGDEDFSEHCHHILNTPKRVSSIGAFIAAASDNASTSRLLRGSMMPSSQSRALA